MTALDKIMFCSLLILIVPVIAFALFAIVAMGYKEFGVLGLFVALWFEASLVYVSVRFSAHP